MFRVGLFVLLLSLGPAPLAEGQSRLTLGQLLVRYRVAKNTRAPAGELAEQLDDIERRGAAALRAGHSGQVRRLIAEANALLRGRPWTELDAFGASLTLRTDQSVIDPAQVFVGRLTQSFPVSSPAPVRLSLSLHQRRPGRSASPGSQVRAFNPVEALPSDLIDEPAVFSLDLSGIDDGVYVLWGEVFSQEGPVARLSAPIQVVGGIALRQALFEERMSGLDVRPDTRASILYPFDFARRANLGEIGPERINIAEKLARSERLLTALGSGREPLYEAKGSLERHYRFEEADAIMPYRLYVPSSYERGKPHPLILGLHGQGGTEAAFFRRDDGLLEQLAERHGFLVATVLGYSPTGGYGR